MNVTCREFADFMADYLSGELAPDLRQPFDYHLSLCVNRQRYSPAIAKPWPSASVRSTTTMPRCRRTS